MKAHTIPRPAFEHRLIEAGSVPRPGKRPGLLGRVPDFAVRHLKPPADPDDLVGVIRWGMAWRLDLESIDAFAATVEVDADRLTAFMQAPARRAGDLLTLSEVARITRALEERLVDRELPEELDDMQAIAEVYIEVAMADGVAGSYTRALETARAVRRRYRAGMRRKLAKRHEQSPAAISIACIRRR